MTLLEYVKQKMEITHTKKDDIITQEINSAALDLSVSGVSVYDETDGEKTIKEDILIWNAIASYVMWHDDTHGKADQYMRDYNRACASMGNCGDYKYV